MRIGYIPFMLMCLSALPARAQSVDSAEVTTLERVVVSGSYEKTATLSSAQPVEVVGEAFMREYFTGNFTQTLQHIPGVHSMDIGSGFSKPAIRGMGFNRISVTENGIKQEGQQWGADHGLEIDAFDVERITVRKGPASLIYGSDAMGGAIEITRIPPPSENLFFGEAILIGGDANRTLGGSAMLGVKRGAWYTKLRYTEQRFGDIHVPTDTVVYLTRRLPIEGRRLKNTAGVERDASLYTDFRKGRYRAGLAVSGTYQKVGFFAGAHGIPSIDRLKDDGDSRNVEMPYSTVSHLKVTTHQQYTWDRLTGYWNVGFQRNHRTEWSLFHTHYGGQSPPAVDPDKELEFSLNTLSSSLRAITPGSGPWEHTAGWDIQYQQNRIAGYSFLLPEYTRLTSGLFWLTTWQAGRGLSVSGGLRYDYGRLDISAYSDPYLEAFLLSQGYDEETIAEYRWRSNPVERNFGDFSGSLGMVWNPGGSHLVKVNLGRSFRLPGANELASNGVHHGTFRHEQGDSSLSSERGWQLDASWSWESEGVSLSFTPFASWFGNYIYLRPTGQWSILPHAGQIYRYSGAEALFAGAETQADVDIAGGLGYSFSGEYVYGRNLTERIPLPFSPPASMRNTVTWRAGRFRIWTELHSIAAQKSVSRNEEPTPGANLWNMGASVDIPFAGSDVEITLSGRNLLNAKYYNHLSFYRQVEIPEPGRAFQILIKIPFNTKIK